VRETLRCRKAAKLPTQNGWQPKIAIRLQLSDNQAGQLSYPRLTVKRSLEGFLAGAFLCFVVVPLGTSGQPTPRDATNPWAQAESAIADHLKRVDPNMQSGEFASNLLRKYLPDFRLFVRFDRHYSNETRLFFVNRNGEITELPEEEWRGDPAEECFRVKRIVDFLKQRTLKVQSAEEAVAVSKLFEEIQGAANYAAFLKINTKDFTVFDKAFIEGQFGPRTDWKYTATPRAGGWKVKVEYVGPPASIQQPPTYELDLNEQGAFQDFRRYPYLSG
jgi:hypothetical protein